MKMDYCNKLYHKTENLLKMIVNGRELVGNPVHCGRKNN
jgi:hypothetical protein